METQRGNTPGSNTTCSYGLFLTLFYKRKFQFVRIQKIFIFTLHLFFIRRLHQVMHLNMRAIFLSICFNSFRFFFLTKLKMHETQRPDHHLSMKSQTIFSLACSKLYYAYANVLCWLERSKISGATIATHCLDYKKRYGTIWGKSCC